MLLDELAAAIVGVDPGDLQELARIHDRFQRIQEAEDADPKARAIAADAAKMVEAIILQETDDVGRSLRALGEAVGELQALMDGSRAAGGTLPGAGSAAPSPPPRRRSPRPRGGSPSRRKPRRPRTHPPSSSSGAIRSS